MARVVDGRSARVGLASLVIACGGCTSHEGTTGRAQSTGGASASAAAGNGPNGPNGPMLNLGGNGSASSRRLVVTAEATTLDVTIGKTPKQIALKATEDGVSVDAAWTVDRGDIGNVSPANGGSVVFIPTGTTGGSVRVSASISDGVGEVTLLVRLSGTQNGARVDDPQEASQIAS